MKFNYSYRIILYFSLIAILPSCASGLKSFDVDDYPIILENKRNVSVMFSMEFEKEEPISEYSREIKATVMGILEEFFEDSPPPFQDAIMISLSGHENDHPDGESYALKASFEIVESLFGMKVKGEHSGDVSDSYTKNVFSSKLIDKILSAYAISNVREVINTQLIIESKRYASAIPFFEQLKNLNPDDPFPPSALAVLHLKLDDRDGALNSLKGHIPKQTDISEVYERLSKIFGIVGPDYYIALAQACDRTGEYAAGIEYYRKALDNGADEIPTRTALARMFEKSGYLPLAIEEYESAADTARAAGELDESLSSCSQIIRIVRMDQNLADESDLPERLLVLGYDFLSNGKEETAKKVFQQAATFHKDPDRMFNSLRKIARSPNVRACLVLARALQDEGKDEWYLKILQGTLELAPSDPRIHSAIGEVFEESAEYSQSAKHYSLAMEGFIQEKDYTQAGLLLARAIEVADSGDAVMTDAQKSALYFKLAEEHYRGARYDDAINYYEKGLELNSEEMQILTTVADIYYLKGNETEAMKYYKKALALKEKQESTSKTD